MEGGYPPIFLCLLWGFLFVFFVCFLFFTWRNPTIIFLSGFVLIPSFFVVFFFFFFRTVQRVDFGLGLVFVCYSFLVGFFCSKWGGVGGCFLDFSPFFFVFCCLGSLFFCSDLVSFRFI